MIDPAKWVYVVVQDPGRNETILGLRSAEEQIAFIPFFQEREAAALGISRLNIKPGATCEIQAIIYGDLVEYARKNNFLLFLLDSAGRILSKNGPDGRPF